MSIKLVSQALDLDLPPSEKIVLVVYANYADEHGIAYPSIPTVARKASLSERQTRRLVHQLVDKELLVPEGKKQFMGRRVNVYRVDMVAAIPLMPFRETKVKLLLPCPTCGKDIPPDVIHSCFEVASTPDNMSGQDDPPPDTRDTPPLTPVSPNPSLQPSVTRDSSNEESPREALFEAMYEHWTGKGYLRTAKVPNTMRSRLNAGVREALAAGISVEEYRQHAMAYQRKFPGLPRTPQAILGNWGDLDPNGTRPPMEPKAIDPEECDHLWQEYEDGTRVCVRCKMEELEGAMQ